MRQEGNGAGRTGTRRRTRKAIVQAAMDLLAQGAAPSIADISRAADVSRRTIYMYFATIEQLLADAALGLATESVINPLVSHPGSPDDVEARIDALARGVQRMSSDTERLGRTIIRLTVEAPAHAAVPTRGYRRIEWIEAALAPLRGRLDPPRFERLVSAIAMVIGWEALVVQRDIRRLDARAAEDVSAWAARALVRAALDECRSAGPRKAPVRRRRH